MKRIPRFVIALAALVAAGCGRSDGSATGGSASGSVGGSAASGAGSGASNTPVKVVPHQKLLEFLPNPPGWTREEPQGETVTEESMSSGTGTSRHATVTGSFRPACRAIASVRSTSRSSTMALATEQLSRKQNGPTGSRQPGRPSFRTSNFEIPCSAGRRSNPWSGRQTRDHDGAVAGRKANDDRCARLELRAEHVSHTLDELDFGGGRHVPGPI